MIITPSSRTISNLNDVLSPLRMSWDTSSQESLPRVSLSSPFQQVLNSTEWLTRTESPNPSVSPLFSAEKSSKSICHSLAKDPGTICRLFSFEHPGTTCCSSVGNQEWRRFSSYESTPFSLVWLSKLTISYDAKLKRHLLVSLFSLKTLPGYTLCLGRKTRRRGLCVHLIDSFLCVSTHKNIRNQNALQ